MDLLLCLLLCCAAAFSHQSEVIKVVVKEDQDVLLNCALDGENIQDDVFDWKKDGRQEVFFYTKGSLYNNGKQEQDEAFKGRVFHFPEQLAAGNASIVIRKSQVKDRGVYTCDFPFPVPKRRAQYQLVVGAVRKPIPTVSKTTDGVQLQCVVEGAFPKPRVEWWDSSGKVLPGEPTFTQKDIGYDAFLQVIVKESGKYRCVATQDEIHNQVFTETFAPGAASKPSVTILKNTKDGALLQCEVLGASPKPEVFLKDDSGNIIEPEDVKETEQGGSYDVVLQTTVTEEGFYHCHVTQKDINHHVSTKIHVYFGDSSTGWIIGFVVVSAILVVVLLLLAALAYKQCRHNSSGGSQRPPLSEQHVP